MRKALIDNITVTIHLNDGIVIAIWKNTSIDLNIAKQAVQERVACTNNKPYPVISNIKAIKNISKEARDFLATEAGCEGIIAAAILIDSDLGSMIGNFWIKINKPLRPTKLFTDEESAKKWLAQYVTKE